MPATYQSFFFTEIDGLEFPDHLEACPNYRDQDTEKLSIECHDLDTGATELLAINIDEPAEAKLLMAGALERARTYNEFSMYNMRGFAIVGPRAQQPGASRNTVGIGWRLRNGYRLSVDEQKLLDSLY